MLRKEYKRKSQVVVVTCTAGAESCATLVTGEDYPRLIDPESLVAIQIGKTYTIYIIYIYFFDRGFEGPIASEC